MLTPDDSGYLRTPSRSEVFGAMLDNPKLGANHTGLDHDVDFQSRRLGSELTADVES